ncbi:hypothetical protein H0H87_009992 [Tephrocybe sp. NHM501043]|nr:hypothetical protein H0H87_009992 [Tephrocybe sp. NHM501043]
MDYVYRRFWRASLEAILPLTPDGGLDLKLVKDLWGLETCIPVSPIRWKAVEPTTSDSLSPFAVVELRELYDCISFIEPPNTEAYRKKRQLQAQKEKEDLLLLLLTVLLNIILYMIVPSSYSPNLPVAWSETLFLASVWFLDFYKS